MKVALCELKKNLQGTNSDGKETRTQNNGLDQKEETFNQNKMKKQENKKNEEPLRNLQASLNVPTSKS